MTVHFVAHRLFYFPIQNDLVLPFYLYSLSFLSLFLFLSLSSSLGIFSIYLISISNCIETILSDRRFKSKKNGQTSSWIHWIWAFRFVLIHFLFQNYDYSGKFLVEKLRELPDEFEVMRIWNRSVGEPGVQGLETLNAENLK